MASDSDCFSKAMVSTRSWTPEATRLLATMAVEPPTEPAVCTRSIGLPTAPSASARYSSGIIRPSKKSGALPTTTASMSAHVMPASSRARMAASRTRPAMDTSPRVAWWRGLADPTTATRSHPSQLASRTANEVLLQAVARGGVGHAPTGRARGDAVGHLADADQPGRHHRVGGQRPARRVDVDVVAQAQRLAQDHLLGGEGGVELGDVERAVADPGRLGRQAGGGRVGEVPQAEGVHVDAVVDAPDPRRVLGQLTGPVRRRRGRRRRRRR